MTPETVVGGVELVMGKVNETESLSRVGSGRSRSRWRASQAEKGRVMRE